MDPYAIGRFVLDVGAGYLAEKALEPVLEPTVKALRSVLLPLWDPAFAAVKLELREHIERERGKDAEFAARLERTLQQGEGAALVASFLRSAAQATTDERMRMLAAAAAGVFVPDLDTEMRSRVARAVQQLEPSDVLRLRRYAEYIRLPGRMFRSRRSGMHLGPTLEGLQVSGCVQVRQEDDLTRQVKETLRNPNAPVRVGSVVEVTLLGNAVLRALQAWKVGGETPSSEAG